MDRIKEDSPMKISIGMEFSEDDLETIKKFYSVDEITPKLVDLFVRTIVEMGIHNIN